MVLYKALDILGIRQFVLGVYHSVFLFIRLLKKGGSNTSPEDIFNQEKSETIAETYFESIHSKIRLFCFINGSIFFSCVCYIDYIILPLIDWIIYKIFWVKYHFIITFLVHTFFKCLILYCWSLSTLLFFSLFQMYKFGNKQHTKTSIFMFVFKFFKGFFARTLDILTVFTFEIVLLVQSMLMCLIPLSFVSSILFHVHFSFFLSFLVFDFKWSIMGWDIERKIDFFETRCMYFLGFGLVLSILFNLPGSVIYNTTFSTFFIPIIVFNVM